MNKSSLSNMSKNNNMPARIAFIKKITENDNIVKIDPLVDFNQSDTEYYTNYTNGTSSEGSFDTNVILKKKTLNFRKVIDQMTNNTGKLDYIKSGTTGHTFKVNAYDSNGTYNLAVKVVAYPKKNSYGGIEDSRRPENAELLTIKLLAYFIKKRKSPHITLPITTFNTSIETFIGLVEKDVVKSKNIDQYIEFEKTKNSRSNDFYYKLNTYSKNIIKQ